MELDKTINWPQMAYMKSWKQSIHDASDKIQRTIPQFVYYLIWMEPLYLNPLLIEYSMEGSLSS